MRFPSVLTLAASLMINAHASQAETAALDTATRAAPAAHTICVKAHADTLSMRASPQAVERRTRRALCPALDHAARTNLHTHRVFLVGVYR